MSVFQCVDCEHYYCAECDGGSECGQCGTAGARCEACAYEHDEEHKDGDVDEDEPDDEAAQ